MILEHALLCVVPGQEQQFERDFGEAEKIISAAQGYLGHKLIRGIETRSQYLLLVKWESVRDHTEGFRKSADYQRWKTLLHHHYQPFPEVLHFALDEVVGAGAKSMAL